MKTYLFILIFIFTGSILGYSQFNLPKGYTFSNDASEQALQIKSDFNRDGKKDMFAVIEKEGNASLIAFISLGQKKYKTVKHADLTDFACCNSISFDKNVISIETKGMRFFQYYRFRFNKKLGDFELIGYDTESFGNYSNDGAGKQSLNLLTGDYSSSVYTAKDEKSGDTKNSKKKMKLPKKYTLRNFNEAVTFLEQIEQ